jgi:hydrogenase expression/formation protein HypD
MSGLAVRSSLAHYDAAVRHHPKSHPVADATECISGAIMRGVAKPPQCPAFGTRCTPEHPIGAPMVSSEGACAAYYRYRNRAAAPEAAARTTALVIQ